MSRDCVPRLNVWYMSRGVDDYGGLDGLPSYPSYEVRSVVFKSKLSVVL